MSEIENFRSAGHDALGPALASAASDGLSGASDENHPCHPCFLARSNTVAIVIGLSRANASAMYLSQRALLSGSLYPGARCDASSSTCQSSSDCFLYTAASC